MTSITEVLRRTTTITFDCYGTLIDWKGGLARSFRELFGDLAMERASELYEAYVWLEAEVEAEAYRSYRQVLTTTVERLADRLGLELKPERAGLLAEMLPDWPAFADADQALKRLKNRYHLGVLSNIDRDLFARTARQFDVVFDFVITAQDVRSYKPAHAHFERLIHRPAEPASNRSRERPEAGPTVHVAQSLYHDGVPAGELGLAFVWINRYKDSNSTHVRPVAEFADLKSFADVACKGE